MKKNIIAACGLGIVAGLIAGETSAQTSVTLYGIVDAGLVYERGGAGGSLFKVGSGIASTSRIGFRGTEDLGGGLSAVFVLEAGFRTDTGEIDTAGQIFNRQSFVGLKSNSLGTLTLGRQYTPLYNTITTVADPFAAGFAGSAKNLLPTAGAETRTSNTILYVSPKLSGLSGELAYSMGEQVGSTKAGAQYGAAVTYGNGPLNLRAAYNYRNNDTSSTTPLGSGKNTLFAGNYDFGVLKVFAAYGIDKGLNSAPLANTANPYGALVRPTASTDSRDILVGLQVPFGVQTIIASYIHKDDKTSFNQDADQWGIAYTYSVSTRTLLYTSYAKINNKNGAGYTVGNNAETGSGNSAINFGIRHSF